MLLPLDMWQEAAVSVHKPNAASDPLDSVTPPNKQGTLYTEGVAREGSRERVGPDAGLLQTACSVLPGCLTAMKTQHKERRTWGEGQCRTQ